MTAICPDGHVSPNSDYCDQCGARINSPCVESAPQPSASSLAVREADPAGGTCPGCGARRAAGDRFCEVCGHDFLRGTSRTAAPPAPEATAADEWEAVITADRAYFDRLAPEAVDFPEKPSERVVTLTEDEFHVGRAEPPTGPRPAAALTGAAADPAISRLHAIFVRQTDGSYAIVDRGSTNGTWINDDADQIAANIPVALGEGDRVYLGAWTKIKLRRRPDGGKMS